VIFYSNGYEHWVWDDAMYPPRAVQGFYKKAELELLPSSAGAAARHWPRPRSTRQIVERYYQTRGPSAHCRSLRAGP
jgi:type I restriction enzyme R subunit